MSIKLINIEYRNLKQRESDINYRFEPPFVKTNEFQKRDLNYNDLKKDFIEELAAYGFSPYMHKTFAAQSKDKNITKYKKQFFNFGLSNYVRRKHKTNLKEQRKDEAKQITDNNRPIEGHFLYHTIYKVEKYSQDRKKNDSATNKEKKYRKSSVITMNNSKTTKNIFNRNSNQIEYYHYPRTLFDDNLKKIFSKENKLKLKDNYIYSVKSQKNIHPILSMSNGDIRSEVNIKTTLSNYVKPTQKRSKIELMRYPTLMQLTQMTTTSTKQSSSSITTSLTHRKSNSIRKKYLEELENSPNGIFKTARKIRNKRKVNSRVFSAH